MAREERQEEAQPTAWMADVLVVDDNALVRAGLVRLLRAWGWSVATTDSGGAAFGLLGAGRYGCVVSDHRMPEGDGLELVRRWAEIRGAVLVPAGRVAGGL